MSNASIDRADQLPPSQQLRAVPPHLVPGRFTPLLTPPAQPPSPSRPLTWSDSVAEELQQAQTRAAREWLDAVRDAEQVQERMSREAQVEHVRRVQALRCVTEAMHRHAAASAASDVSGPGSPACRVVIAHRLDWFASSLADALEQHGMVVVSQLDDGAEALGATIAEQPDLLVLQGAMVRLPAEAVLTEVQHFAPRTVVAVQVDGPERAQALHELGANAAFARNLPPAQVADRLLDVLSALRSGGPSATERDIDLR